MVNQTRRAQRGGRTTKKGGADPLAPEVAGHLESLVNDFTASLHRIDELYRRVRLRSSMPSYRRDRWEGMSRELERELKENKKIKAQIDGVREAIDRAHMAGGKRGGTRRRRQGGADPLAPEVAGHLATLANEFTASQERVPEIYRRYRAAGERARPELGRELGREIKKNRRIQAQLDGIWDAIHQAHMAGGKRGGADPFDPEVVAIKQQSHLDLAESMRLLTGYHRRIIAALSEGKLFEDDDQSKAAGAWRRQRDYAAELRQLAPAEMTDGKRKALQAFEERHEAAVKKLRQEQGVERERASNAQRQIDAIREARTMA